MNCMTCIAVAIVAVTLGACAQSPTAIQPTYVSTVPYLDWPCSKLGDKRQQIASALAAASAQQSQARLNDAIGVLLIGLPVSSMSEQNVAPQIAHLKGEQQALNEAMALNSCGT
jgi:hypothetical protein